MWIVFGFELARLWRAVGVSITDVCPIQPAKYQTDAFGVKPHSQLRCIFIYSITTVIHMFCWKLHAQVLQCYRLCGKLFNDAFLNKQSILIFHFILYANVMSICSHFHCYLQWYDTIQLKPRIMHNARWNVLVMLTFSSECWSLFMRSRKFTGLVCRASRLSSSLQDAYKVHTVSRKIDSFKSLNRKQIACNHEK